MASEHPGETSVSLTLPDSLSDWLDDVAQSEDLSREDVLLQLLSAYRQVEGEGAPEGEGALDDGELTVDPIEGPADELVAELRADIESMVEAELEDREAEIEDRETRIDDAVEAAVADLDIEDRIEAAVEDALDDRDVSAPVDGQYVDESTLDERVEDVESQFMELLDDVRDRVVQVKRETDEKAPADHEHPERDRQLATVERQLDELRTSIESVESQMGAGFDNFEEVLAYLTDSIDELSARQTKLARAVVETRDELRVQAAAEASRNAADELRQTANRQGVSTATCEDCERTVDIGLLSRTQCPHCSATFSDVRPASGYFGTAVLETGDRPALEPGEVDETGFEHGVQRIIDTESPAAETGSARGDDEMDPDEGPGDEDDG